MMDTPQKGQRTDLVSSLADVRERLTQAEHHLRVEEAMDRIRERTMTMRGSEEMADLIALVFKELRALGFENQTCTLSIIDADTHDSEIWRISDQDQAVGESYYVPAFDHPVYNNVIRGWQDQSSFVIVELNGERLKSYYTHLFENSEYGRLPLETQQAILNTPQVVWTMVFMKHGTLAVVDYGLTSRALDESRIAILRRVARTFDLTYTRFLDLQKAEARAQEARQEASVNRIRAEIISMKSTRDLAHISASLWTELTRFNISFIRCGILLIDEAQASLEVFLTRNDGSSFDPFLVPFESNPMFPRAVESWRKQEIFVETWDKHAYDVLAQYLIQQGVMLEEDKEIFEEASMDGVKLTFIPFVYGHLYIGSRHQLLEEQITFLNLLANTFSVAFARYYDFKQLEAKNEELAKTLHNLETTQSQLVQSEKLASLGKLTAGIAHEIKNPLNFVNNFAQISIELAEELEDALQEGEDVESIIQDLKQNADQITKHGRRAASIVNSMMQHASGSQGTRQDVEVNVFIAEYMNLAYHGMRARMSDFNTNIVQDFDDKAGVINIVPQDIGRVLINLFNNAFFAMHDKVQREHAGNSTGSYRPELTVKTHRGYGQVDIFVSDNGPGIPDEILGKIFEPFFTTKPAGSGTGLGLSLSFDIITQGHNGQLTVHSKPGAGTTFKISLPA